MIDDYNAGASSIDQLWAQLYGLTQTLNAEAQRHVSEQLSEEELALFDALTRPDITLSTVERAQVKDLVRNLLATLKREKLVLDWRKKQQARASVQVAIEEGLHALPDVYTAALFTDPAARKESASPLRWLDRYCRSASAWRIRRTRAEYIWRCLICLLFEPLIMKSLPECVDDFFKAGKVLLSHEPCKCCASLGANNR